MIPIQDILNRIHWDPEFGRGEFVIGYYDRIEDDIVKVPLRELYFDPEDHFSFQLLDTEGEVHSVPFHRIKALYRNGELIWHREH